MTGLLSLCFVLVFYAVVYYMEDVFFSFVVCNIGLARASAIFAKSSSVSTPIVVSVSGAGLIQYSGLFPV